MTTADVAAGAAAGLAVALPPGPVAGYLVGLGARSPWRTAAAAALGVATVDGAYAIAAAAGGVGLQAWVSRAEGPLAVLAAVVLVGVAVRTTVAAVVRYRRPAELQPAGPPRPGRAYLTLVAMTAVNPATLVTFGAVVVARSGRAGPADLAAVTLFALAAATVSALWQLTLASSGTVLAARLTGRRGRLGLALVSGLVMLVLAAGTLLG